MRRLILSVFVLLAACADRDAAPILPSALNAGTNIPIFVGTTRQIGTQGELTRDRAAELAFFKYDISAPPGRKPGTVPQGHDRPDPAKHFVFASQGKFNDASEFENALSQHIKQRPKSDREVTIYVHGYNNSFSDGTFRLAQLKQDLKLPGTAVHYSWPSSGNPLGYTYDRDSVLIARDGLEQLLLSVQVANPSKIILTGHSMGTLLIMETLRQIEIRSPGWAQRSLDGVVLMSSDIDLDLFKTQAARIESLPEPFAIFVSDRDRALQLSARLNGSRKRLGALDDISEVGNLPVTLVDVSKFASLRDGGHFTPGTSATLVQILGNIASLDQAFRSDRAGRAGILPGTVITLRNATQLILSPNLLKE